MATRHPVVPDERRAVAAHGLRPAGDPVRPADWDGFLSWATRQGMTGHAMQALADGALILEPHRSETLQDVHRARMAACLILEHKLLGLLDAFAAADVPVLILKGASFAHTAYADPTLRPFGDIDVLVPADRFDAASGVLVEHGHTRRLAEPRPGFVQRFGKAAVHRDASGEVDLHRTLVLGPYAMWVDVDRLFGGSTTFELGGRAVACLGPTHRLLHACMHAVLGAEPPERLPKWSAVRDVAQLERQPGLDADAFARDARAWRLEPVVERAAGLVRSHLGIEPGPVLRTFDGTRPTRLQRRVLDAYLGPHRNEGTSATSMLRVIPGVRAKLSYLRATVLPDRGFIADREGGSGLGGYAARWRRLARAIRTRTTGR